MNKLYLILLIVIAVALLGTWPLQVLIRAFEWLNFWLARLIALLNGVGWTGIL